MTAAFSMNFTASAEVTHAEDTDCSTETIDAQEN